MTTSDIISLVSAIATICSTLVAFIALWKQLSAINTQLAIKNKQLQIQQFSDYTKRYQEIIYRFPEEINESTFQVSGHDEYRQIMRGMRNYFDLCFEEWLLNKRGYLDQDTWSVWRGEMRTALSKTAFRQAWSIVRKDTRHGAEFESFFSDLANAPPQ